MSKEGGAFDLATLRGVGFEDDGYKGPAPFGPYNYLPTKVIHTICPYILSIHFSIHPVNTSFQYNLSTHPVNTPYQYTHNYILTTYIIITLHLITTPNPPSQPPSPTQVWVRVYFVMEPARFDWDGPIQIPYGSPVKSSYFTARLRAPDSVRQSGGGLRDGKSSGSGSGVHNSLSLEGVLEYYLPDTTATGLGLGQGQESQGSSPDNFANLNGKILFNLRTYALLNAPRAVLVNGVMIGGDSTFDISKGGPPLSFSLAGGTSIRYYYNANDNDDINNNNNGYYSVGHGLLAATALVSADGSIGEIVSGGPGVDILLPACDPTQPYLLKCIYRPKEPIWLIETPASENPLALARMPDPDLAPALLRMAPECLVKLVVTRGSTRILWQPPSEPLPGAPSPPLLFFSYPLSPPLLFLSYPFSSPLFSPCPRLPSSPCPLVLLLLRSSLFYPLIPP